MDNEAKSKKIPILLLKTKSWPTDGYEDYFATAGNGRFKPVFVPVLEHRFKDDALTKLRALVKSGDLGFARKEQCKYGAIIFTSQRAVEVFASVVKDLRKEGIDVDRLLSSDLQLYVVGPATARGLRALELKCPIIGEESGNGEVLAELILSHYTKETTGEALNCKTLPPLLFLVGEKRRDIIPRTLQSQTLPEQHRLKVDELEVYETGERETFKSNFSELWLANNVNGLETQWVIVFSPTGCQAMLEVIGLSKDVTSLSSTTTRVATIGPTTRDFLKREFNFEPDVCAEKPSPEGVGNAILSVIGVPGDH